MTGLFATTVVPFHRVLFVIFTALLGISGSFIASNPDCVANWLSLIGAGIGMYVADVSGEIEINARRLVARGDIQLKGVREDLVKDNNPRLLAPLFLVSIILTLGGLIYGG
jgi:hypothetical protein